MNDTKIQKLYELLNDAILKYGKIDYEIVYAYHCSTFNIKMGELDTVDDKRFFNRDRVYERVRNSDKVLSWGIY